MRHLLAAYLLCGRQSFPLSESLLVSLFPLLQLYPGSDEQHTNNGLPNRYCVMKLTERLKKEGIDINLRDALGVDTDPKLRNLRGKL